MRMGNWGHFLLHRIFIWIDWWALEDAYSAGMVERSRLMDDGVEFVRTLPPAMLDGADRWCKTMSRSIILAVRVNDVNERKVDRISFFKKRIGDVSCLCRFSVDEGRTWSIHNFTSTSVFVDGLLSEPGDETLVMTWVPVSALHLPLSSSPPHVYWHLLYLTPSSSSSLTPVCRLTDLSFTQPKLHRWRRSVWLTPLPVNYIHFSSPGRQFLSSTLTFRSVLLSFNTTSALNRPPPFQPDLFISPSFPHIPLLINETVSTQPTLVCPSPVCQANLHPSIFLFISIHSWVSATPVCPSPPFNNDLLRDASGPFSTSVYLLTARHSVPYLSFNPVWFLLSFGPQVSTCPSFLLTCPSS